MVIRSAIHFNGVYVSQKHDRGLGCWLVQFARECEFLFRNIMYYSFCFNDFSIVVFLKYMYYRAVVRPRKSHLNNLCITRRLNHLISIDCKILR